MQTDLITKVYFNEHLTHSCVGMPQGLQALLSSYNCSSQVFDGPSGQDEMVTQNLIPPILAQYIRINPQAWVGGISLRMEAIGCTQEEQKYCKYTNPSTNVSMILNTHEHMTSYKYINDC